MLMLRAFRRTCLRTTSGLRERSSVTDSHFRRRTIMRTPASIAGHPLHAMLIVFPVGLLVFSLICDLISLASSDATTWAAVARYTMAGGFIGALVVAIPGLIDLRSITDAKVKKIGVMHMSLNLLAVVLYAINLWLRFHGANT